jgi:hypothetical protein
VLKLRIRRDGVVRDVLHRRLRERRDALSSRYRRGGWTLTSRPPGLRRYVQNPMAGLRMRGTSASHAEGVVRALPVALDMRAPFTRTLGDACSTGTVCTSGYCVDGVCCD